METRAAMNFMAAAANSAEVAEAASTEVVASAVATADFMAAEVAK